jgi:hypothetical protein
MVAVRTALVEGDGDVLSAAQHRLDGTAGRAGERAAEPLLETGDKLLDGCHPSLRMLFDAADLNRKTRERVS